MRPIFDFLKPRRLLQLSPDAFSDGQMGSKIWLCEELERVLAPRAGQPLVVCVYAGWYGLLPFLLFTRGRLEIDRLFLFDRDPAAVANALRVNDRWRFDGRFSAHREDVNTLELQSLPLQPNLFINTSCEHFAKQTWWQCIPSGSRVVLQSTDMQHKQHVRRSHSLLQFRDAFAPWRELEFVGQLDFKYDNFNFSRFMLIGIKR